jgi:hypothetical protein
MSAGSSGRNSVFNTDVLLPGKRKPGAGSATSSPPALEGRAARARASIDLTACSRLCRRTRARAGVSVPRYRMQRAANALSAATSAKFCKCDIDVISIHWYAATPNAGNDHVFSG